MDKVVGIRQQRIPSHETDLFRLDEGENFEGRQPRFTRALTVAFIDQARSALRAPPVDRLVSCPLNIARWNKAF